MQMPSLAKELVQYTMTISPVRELKVAYLTVPTVALTPLMAAEDIWMMLECDVLKVCSTIIAVLLTLYDPMAF